ncbi:MAG: glycosyltransferase [Erysipelotrichales bacterium]|nr:glycosyltransferase [Erysipelotrichales bacterium]
MKIIYLTTASTNNDYETIINSCFDISNPSNQNFHNALIRAFGCFHDVEVVSSSLINSEKLTDPTLKRSKSYENHICFNYLPIKNGKINKYITIKKSLNKFLRNQLKIHTKKDILLVIDAMNLTLSSVGQKFAKTHNIKTLGIISDNPNLISNLPHRNKDRLLKLFSKYDYYLCLNENLNSLANKKNKPYLIVNGIFNKANTQNIKEKQKYFFFGGALYEKYGVKTLIHAFLNTGGEYKLLIAGDGPLKEYVVKKATRTRRINYLGTIPQVNLQSYEDNSIANINPRPLTKEFDAYCIPSKVIEYATSKSVTISTYHSILYKTFGSAIIWTKDDEKSLTEIIEKVAEMPSAERNKIISRANNIAEKTYSINKVSLLIKDFLKKVS